MSRQSLQEMVTQFHRELRVYGGWEPGKPVAELPDEIHTSRWLLLSEELGELAAADVRGDVVKIADGIADIIYVLAGTAFVHGIPLDEVLAEVHRSNMTKVNVPDEPKVVKGPGYSPPRIAEILNGEQAMPPCYQSAFGPMIHGPGCVCP
jgi:predicted HAD superfamily Cof-like phosphohydrolase